MHHSVQLQKGWSLLIFPGKSNFLASAIASSEGRIDAEKAPRDSHRRITQENHAAVSDNVYNPKKHIFF